MWKITCSNALNQCLLLALFVYSCRDKAEVKTDNTPPELRIAKVVPEVYKPETDKGFLKHQDTVFYAGHFYTGFIYGLFPDGDTAFIASYFNGVEEGFQRKWYPNKQLLEERFYINGKKEGVHRGWWPDGKPKFIFTAVNDKNEGEFTQWYATGLMEKQFHYVNGQEEGSERLWWDNGTVRANYVIRNGKKYGLTGLKTCINPYDSVINK